jgi:hypothetical protein
MLGGLATALLHGDFTYEQTSRLTGGSMLRMMKMVPGGGKATEPTTTTHLIRGNQMATITKSGIDIIDISAETMTHVDLDKRTYAVITFAELRQMMQKGVQAATGQQSDASLNLDIQVKDGNQRRQIREFDTKLMKLILTTKVTDQKSGQTMNMEMANDFWLAKGVPGYEEVRAFQRRYAEKLGMDMQMIGLSRMMGSQPGMADAMAKMAREASKLDGVPVLTVTRMGGQANMPNLGDAASREANNQARSEASNQASRAAGGRFGGLAGSTAGSLMGGFGRKKKQQQQEEPAPTPQAAPAPAAAAPATNYMMEVTSELTSYSSGPVDGSKFQVPAGFKQVDHDMKKMLK